MRNRRRQSAGKKGQRAEEKQRSKYMQARILQQLTGEGSSEAPPPPQTSDQPDLFQLPPLPGDVFSRDKCVCVCVCVCVRERERERDERECVCVCVCV